MDLIKAVYTEPRGPTKTVSFACSVAAVDKLQQLAQETGRTVSALLRLFVAAGLEELSIYPVVAEVSTSSIKLEHRLQRSSESSVSDMQEQAALGRPNVD